MDTEFSLHPDTDVAWQDLAACKGMTHVFFGPAAERPERRVEREALAMSYCLSCPVILPCRRNARLNHEHGFWGGETDEQRAAAGYAPRSPSRRSVIEARDRSRRGNDREPDERSADLRPDSSRRDDVVRDGVATETRLDRLHGDFDSVSVG